MEKKYRSNDISIEEEDDNEYNSSTSEGYELMDIKEIKRMWNGNYRVKKSCSSLNKKQILANNKKPRIRKPIFKVTHNYEKQSKVSKKLKTNESLPNSQETHLTCHSKSLSSESINKKTLSHKPITPSIIKPSYNDTTPPIIIEDKKLRFINRLKSSYSEFIGKYGHKLTINQ